MSVLPPYLVPGLIGFLIGVSLSSSAGSDPLDEPDPLDDFSFATFPMSPLDGDEELSSLYETVVEAPRAALSAGAARVDRAHIEASHATSTDEALGLVSGLAVVQHGAEGKGHQIFLRGFDAAHGSDVELLVGGVGLGEPSHVHGQGYLDLYGIVPEAVVEIHVNKGPFLPWQGNFATAGSVRLELGVPHSARPGLVRTEVSHRGRLRAVVLAAPAAASEATFAATEAVYDRGFGPHREATRAALTAQGEKALLEHLVLSGLILGNSSRFESPGAMRLADVEAKKYDFYGAYDPAGQGLSDRLLARVGLKRKANGTRFELFLYGGAGRFSLEENFTGALLFETRGDRKRQAQQSVLGGAAVEFDHKLALAFPVAFTGGAGWRVDRVDQREVQVEGNGEAWQVNRDLLATVQHVYSFAGVRMSPFGWLELLPSCRFDLFHYAGTDAVFDGSGGDAHLAVSPRLAISSPLGEAVTLFADYGRGFRAPEARAVVADAGESEDVRVDRYAGGRAAVAIVDAAEVGVAVSSSRGIELSVAGFASLVQQEMVFDHVSNLNVEVGSSRRLGVESIVEIAPRPWMSGRAELTFLDARFAESGNPVPGSSRLLGGASLALGTDRGPRGGARLRWSGERSLSHGASASGYARLDVDAGWRFEHFDVSLVVDNVLNTRIMEGAYHYGSWFDPEETPSALPAIHHVAGSPITGRLVLTAYL